MKFPVYSRRWGHPDNYQIERTAKGWNVQHISIGGECDPTGAPYLFDNLRHDSINYPASLGEYFEWLWGQSKTMDADTLQSNLLMLAAWVEKTEKATPAGIFAEYG